MCGLPRTHWGISVDDKFIRNLEVIRVNKLTYELVYWFLIPVNKYTDLLESYDSVFVNGNKYG